MKLIHRLLNAMDEYLLRLIPSKLIAPARKALSRRLGAHIGRSVTIGTGVHLIGKQGLRICDGVSVARDVTLDGRGGLTLEEGALIGFESVLLTSTHVSDDQERPIQDQGMFSLPTKVGPRVWLGARVIIQPGVTIGASTIVGSGSVVTRDLDDASVYGGVPARLIKRR